MTDFAISDVLSWDETAERRDRKGAKWCETKGFGCWRRILTDGRPPLTHEPVMESALEAARMRARVALPAICHACGRCPWAKL
jgi:hypothetical protein